LDDVIRLRSCASFWLSARERHAGVLDQPLHGALLGVEHAEDVVGVGGEAGQRAERLVDVAPVAFDAAAELLLPGAERVARLRVQRVEDLVELDGLGDLPVRQAPALASLRYERPGWSST
jgi:hypothetical protein